MFEQQRFVAVFLMQQLEFLVAVKVLRRVNPNKTADTSTCSPIPSPKRPWTMSFKDPGPLASLFVRKRFDFSHSTMTMHPGRDLLGRHAKPLKPRLDTLELINNWRRAQLLACLMRARTVLLCQ